MIIDSHMHVNFNGVSTDNIITYMDNNKIAMCWLLTWEENNPLIPSQYMHLSIDDVFEAYQKFPDRIIPMYAPDPSHPDASAKLRFWYGKGIKGCGELKVSLNWKSKDINKLLRCVSDLDIPLIFHMQNENKIYLTNSNSVVDKSLCSLYGTNRFKGVLRASLEHIAQYLLPLREKLDSYQKFFPGYLLDFETLELSLKTYRNINFVGHGPLFWAGISDDFHPKTDYPKGIISGDGIICKLLSEYDNLYADISGPSGFNAIARDIQYTKRFLTKYEDKILFGTDTFNLGQKEFLDSLNLSKRTHKKICYENAIKLING